MFSSYKQISKEIGYVGYTPFPSMEEMDKLLHYLSSNSTISNFKKALSLYRFTPEAKTLEEEKMIHMLQLGLSIAKRDLFQVEARRPFAEVAVNYFLNLIPSLTLFYILRITFTSADQLFHF
jgi:hypothetical protein